MAATWPKTSGVGAANNRTWPLPTTSAWLDTGWTASSMVTCSDCHTSGGGTKAAGPHGSAVEYMIDPAYTTPWEIARGDDPDTSGDQSNYLTTICNKCHADNYVNMNGVHGYTKHFRNEYSAAGKCIGCHVKIPHGWKRPRLIGYTTDPIEYRSISVVGMLDENQAPARGSSPGWSKNDCATTGCDSHPTSMATKWP
jgi:cytochrome c553